MSNKEVFDYGYRDSTNEKNIINFMINKDRQEKAQRGKENIIPLFFKHLLTFLIFILLSF